MILAITYDLNKPGQDYDLVHSAIKKLGDWRHPLESYWVVDTSVTLHRAYEMVKSVCDDSTHLFVARIHSGEYQGWLPKEFWDWMNGRTF